MTLPALKLMRTHPQGQGHRDMHAFLVGEAAACEELMVEHIMCLRAQAAALSVPIEAAAAALRARCQRVALELMVATAACIAAARTVGRRTSLTPFRASWPGEIDGSLPDAEGSWLRAAALKALQELCQAASAMKTGEGLQKQRSRDGAGSPPTDNPKLRMSRTAAKERALCEDGAAVTLCLAAESATRLGLKTSMRAAANAAALQLRVWNSQDEALLARAWSVDLARSRTVSGAGMGEPLIRISTSGECGGGAEQGAGLGCQASEHVWAELSTSGGTLLTEPRCESLRAAVTISWDVRAQPLASNAPVAVLWPQCSAAASERVRQQWQERTTVIPAEAGPGSDQQLSAGAADEHLADSPDSAHIHWPPEQAEPAADDISSKHLDMEEMTLRPRR